MRLGMVRGHVVLHSAVNELRGNRLVVIEPVTAESLTAGCPGGGKSLVAVDKLGAGVGQMVAFVEGREAANPFWPQVAPVDAYCALIVESIDFRPAAAAAGPRDKA